MKIFDIEFPKKGPIKKMDGLIFVKIDNGIRRNIFECLKASLSKDSLFFYELRIPEPGRRVEDMERM